MPIRGCRVLRTMKLKGPAVSTCCNKKKKEVCCHVCLGTVPVAARWRESGAYISPSSMDGCTGQTNKADNDRSEVQTCWCILVLQDPSQAMQNPVKQFFANDSTKKLLYSHSLATARVVGRSSADLSAIRSSGRVRGRPAGSASLPPRPMDTYVRGRPAGRRLSQWRRYHVLGSWTLRPRAAQRRDRKAT